MGWVKGEVAEVLIAELEPIQRHYHELMNDQTELRAILDEGAARIRPIAQATLREVQSKMGLR